MKKINKIKIITLKNNAYKLRVNYQIPYKLMYFINKIDERTSKEFILYLIGKSEQLIRVKGYYKKYIKEEQKANAELVKEILNNGLL